MESVLVYFSFIAVAIAAAYTLILNKRLERLEKAHAHHLQFQRMYLQFTLVQDIRQKVRYAELLTNLIKETSYPGTDTVLDGLDAKALGAHLDNQLAQFFIDKIDRLPLNKAITTIEHLLNEIWSSVYADMGGDKRILAIIAEKTDFGFLRTLREIYGAEHVRDAGEKFASAKLVYTTFAEKKKLQNFSIQNNFHYISEELEKRGTSSIKLIISEWIHRGGKPSGATYRKLVAAIGTGY